METNYAEFFQGTSAATNEVWDVTKRYRRVTYWYNSIELGTRTEFVARGKVKSREYDLTEAGKKIASGASRSDVSLGRV